MVVFGLNEPDNLRIMATTFKAGDPSYAGALGGRGVVLNPSRGIMYGSRAFSGGGAIQGARMATTANTSNNSMPTRDVGLVNNALMAFMITYSLAPRFFAYCNRIRGSTNA